MLIWVLIICIVFFLGAVFYKQTIQEYKLNQIEWSQADRLSELLEEGTPFVLRSMPICPVWSASDVRQRSEFKELADWVGAAGADGVMPWHEYMATVYGRKALLEPWLDETLTPILPRIRSYLPFLFPRDIQVWAGGRGLYSQRPAWTLLFPTDGSIIVTLMSTKEDKYMPTVWQGRFADSFTVADSPYVSQLKYLDVKLRPGTALFIPAHWKVSWAAAEGPDGNLQMPFVCIIGLHTPISKLATVLTPTSGPATAQPKPKPGAHGKK